MLCSLGIFEVPLLPPPPSHKWLRGHGLCMTPKLLVVGKLGTIKEDECVVYSMSSMNIVMLIVTEYVEQK